MNQCLTVLADLVAGRLNRSLFCPATSSLGGSITRICIYVFTAGKLEIIGCAQVHVYLLCSFRWFILGGLSLADSTVSRHTILRLLLTVFEGTDFLVALLPTAKSGRSAFFLVTSSSWRSLSSAAAIFPTFVAFSRASAACFSALAAAAAMASS